VPGILRQCSWNICASFNLAFETTILSWSIKH